MTREEFKDTAMNILLNEEFGGWTELFDSNNINDYKVAQYDEEDDIVMSNIPLNDFLDELYEVIK
jgi:hypothetical protein